MKQKTKYDTLALLLFTVSSYFKLNNLSIIEYKFDQQFGFNVLKSCKDGNYFSYIDGSSGLPQGLLHYLFECIGGIFGISDYVNLVRFEIIISQISLFFIYILLSKHIGKFISLCSMSLVLLNPYLIIATRNISSAEHYELYILIYLYLFFNFKNIKHGVKLLSLFSSISLIIYFPMFIFLSTFLLVIIAMDKTRELKNYFFGYAAGLILNFLSYLPYINAYGVPSTRNTSTSWGITSYWRIYYDTFSSSSLLSKVNNQSDLSSLQFEFNYFDDLLLLNKILVLVLFFYFLFKYSRQLKRKSIEINIDLISFTSLTFSGIIFTLLDRPLYAHYFFTLIIFVYISIVRSVEKKILTILICLILNISNIFIYTSFISFVETNNGIQNSDYGTIYINCGCCVEDARVCRGQ